MAEELEADVRYVLQPSEDVRISLEVLLITRPDSNAAESDNIANKAVLAVVTHKNQATDQDEGRCVFSI